MKKYFLFMFFFIGISVTTFAQKMENPILIKVGDKCLNCTPPYAAPCIIDFDNDGLQDLIVGTWKGEFRFYKNIGSKTKPVYKDYTMIQANGKNAVARNW